MWYAPSTCIPYVHQHGMVYVSFAIIGCEPLHMAYDYGFKMIIYDDQDFETVMQHVTMVSKRSFRMARVLKRSSMNLQGVPKGPQSLSSWCKLHYSIVPGISLLCKALFKQLSTHLRYARHSRLVNRFHIMLCIVLPLRQALSRTICTIFLNLPQLSRDTCGCHIYAYEAL